MSLEQIPLIRQVDMVFREIREELLHLTSGIVFIQIRNNLVGKFGVRHDPIESKDGKMKAITSGLSELQFHAFRQMGVQSLQQKTNWTHGEILFEFALKPSGVLHTSVQFESHYNMANLLLKMESMKNY